MINTCFEKWHGAPEENFIENQMVWCSDQKYLSITTKLEHPGNSNTLENYFVNPGNSNVRVSRGMTVDKELKLTDWRYILKTRHLLPNTLAC